MLTTVIPWTIQTVHTLRKNGWKVDRINELYQQEAKTHKHFGDDRSAFLSVRIRQEFNRPDHRRSTLH